MSAPPHSPFLPENLDKQMVQLANQRGIIWPPPGHGAYGGEIGRAVRFSTSAPPKPALTLHFTSKEVFL